MESIRLYLRRLLPATVALLGTLALTPDAGLAQWQVGGSGYGSSVRLLGTTTQSPVASLPSGGGYDVGEAQSFGVPDAVSAQWLTAVATGSVSSGESPASQTVSEAESVSVLNGLVRADAVTAVASSYVTDAGAASNATGSGFVNLVVNGVAYTTDVAPNTRVDIPLVGYVVLNEQIPSGDGASSSGIQVNMIHVRLLNGGEIILGSASSSVAR
ncbi:MAG TPA: choice-of-anchor P family protein [Gemmatimonadaceae bacterium]|nr:choice-of-anchor P family protein [Gemmatimonadaceae bacterium]